MAGFIPFIPAAVSVAGSLLGGDSAPSPNVYQPGGTGQQDANLQGLLNSNTNFLSGPNNPYTVYNPQFLQAFQQLFNTPGTAGYNTAATNAGNAYTNVGNQGLGLSQLLASASPLALAGGSQVLNMGLDPQQALYNRTLQQVTDQSNVHNAMYGLTGQQAAGNVDQATGNFNIDWQNNELQRALQGLRGYDTAANTAGTAATNAQNIGSAGAGSILAGGAAPYQTGQTIGANQETALSQLISQLMGPVTSSQSTIGDLAGYMNQGINASASQGSQQLANYYAGLTGAQAGATGGYALGNALSSLFNTQATPTPTSGINSAGLDFLSSYGF